MQIVRRLIATLKRPSPVYLGDYTILLRTSHGYKLFVDSRDVSLAPHIIMDGVWEPAVTRLLDERVHQGMHVIDVGANVGYHSVHMADRVGVGGMVACFEANARLAQLLAQSLEVNNCRSRSVVHPSAVGAHVGHSEFKVFEHHLGASSLIVSDSTAAEYHDTITRVTVPATTIDVTCADWTRLDFLKIDAEGAEPLVLEGAKGLIARSPSLEILLEFAPAFWPSVESAREFLEGWSAEGFEINRLTKEGRVEPAAISEVLDPTTLEELLLTRKRH